MLHPNASQPLFERSWLPTIAFTWRIMTGTIVTFLVGILFSTVPRSSIGEARENQASA
jgi:hypothetical protein